jgi:hypothetical protein
MIDDDAGPGAVQTRKPAMAWLLAGALATFVAGLLFSPWFEQNVRTRLPGALQTPDVGAVAASVSEQQSALAALTARVDALEARPVGLPAADGSAPPLNDPAAIAGVAGGGDVERVARIESRVDAIDRSQTQVAQRVDNLSAEVAGLNVKVANVGSEATQSIEAATASAEAARRVLLVGSVRRALDRGESVAVLAPALRRQFGTEHSGAVERLIAGTPATPTLAALLRGFAALTPRLVAEPAAARDSWWQRFKASIAGVAELRRSDSADARHANALRITEAEGRLRRGDVAGALTLLSRLPRQTQAIAAPWRREAERYVAAQSAIEELEAAVLLGDAAPVTPPVARPAAAGETL